MQGGHCLTADIYLVGYGSSHVSYTPLEHRVSPALYLHVTTNSFSISLFFEFSSVWRTTISSSHRTLKGNFDKTRDKKELNCWFLKPPNRATETRILHTSHITLRRKIFKTRGAPSFSQYLLLPGILSPSIPPSGRLHLPVSFILQHHLLILI